MSLSNKNDSSSDSIRDSRFATRNSAQPEDFGLYEARREHDACGVGAVVNVSGKKDHAILLHGKQILMNLMHRGAAGSDEATGDGAGILFQIPHEFFKAEGKRLGFDVPAPQSYGVAMLFEPRDSFLTGLPGSLDSPAMPAPSKNLRMQCEELFAEAVTHYGMKVIGSRDVPCSNSCLGELALAGEPIIRQAIIDGGGLKDEALERRLYLARKRAERLVREKFGRAAEDFYVTSMSCRTIVYKGMFMAPQLFAYYPDLADERMTTALAIVHQRYSTNTFPNWRLAQPFRMAAHNGEINTLSGNIHHMRARQKSLASDVLGELDDVMPVLVPGGSDSAMFDNCLELLVRAGRSLPHSVMMMMPEAFGSSYHISTDKRAFYEYHASMMEPWDGPAAMVFTDGKMVGGTLDRNGLRPCRYVLTTDGLMVLASEVGVIEFPPERIQQKGRLQPGRMFIVDTEEGRLVVDNEIKSKISRQSPYRRWLEQNRIELRGLFGEARVRHPEPQTVLQRLKAFGYTREDLFTILTPMASTGQEPVGSMGNDTPIAVLSEKPKPLFNYFRQLFAQVTNPPIDPLREALVMSLMSFTGKQRNLLTEMPQQCRQLKLPHPILTNEEIERLRSARRDDFRVATIPSLFDVPGNDDPASAGESLRCGLDELVDAAEKAVREGASIIVLSDRSVSASRAAIPSLLALGAVHHSLLEKGLRGEAGIVLETGEPREVMHFCLLCGFGANAVNPYLAFEAIEELRRQGGLPPEMELQELEDHFISAIKKGLLKTMSKMGISTLRSYHSAQLFECIGLNGEVIDRCFTGTSSRIGGVSWDVLARETLAGHSRAFREPPDGVLSMEFGGEYTYRRDGEKHMWNPTTISRLQHAVRANSAKDFDEFVKAANEDDRKLFALRGLFEFVPATPVPLEEVEPAGAIVKRFYTGAMSQGSISKEAHEALAEGMNSIGAMSNTGEGGEDPARYQPRDGVTLNSAIKQVASGRFGVTLEYLANARILQIKMAQGAKPGEGGQLPGHKVTEEIARLRHSTPGVSLISPPPHHDIYSIEDLKQLIYDLKCVNPGVEVSVKLVSEVGVGTIAAGVAKGGADEVLISGHEGGTGASPLSSIKHAGSPWELGLAETQQVLVLNGLRDRIRVQVDGHLKTGRDVVIAALLGAERFGFGTSALVCLGCVLLRKCHLNNCSMGIATQDPELRKRFAGKGEHVARFMMFLAEDVRKVMAQLGFRTVDEMVGQTNRLNVRKAVEHWKACGLDLSAFFAQPPLSPGRQAVLRCVRPPTDPLGHHLDWQILKAVEASMEKGQHVAAEFAVHNVHRAVGTILSNRIVKKHGAKGLPDNTVEVTLHGSAGQSFGAFLAPGVTLKLIGDANDYLGKGLSGGRIVVQTPPGSPFRPHENIIVGNTLLYGATSGEVFINGLAGERFAVRNSGATAVVEGLGDHGCEYMTGGRVIVLGRTGRNFAAGMSGGIAYVLDDHQLFDTLCNLDMVDLETVYLDTDKAFLARMIKRHLELTGSPRARRILEDWRDMVGRFVKVMPIDYRKALQRLRQREQRGGDYTPATEEVFGG